LIGLSKSTKRIVSIEALKSKRLLGASQDGSREFTTLIAAISAAPASIPPALIYKAESHDLQDIWLEDFDTAENIDSAFKAAGIKLWNPQRVLATIAKSTLSPPISPISTIQTPKSIRSLRRTTKRLQKTGHLEGNAMVLLRAAEKFATEAEILRHQNNGLLTAFKDEKRKRKRSNPLGLLDEGEVDGQALFFSSAKVERVRQRQYDQEQTEQQQKQEKAENQLQ